MDEFDRNDLTVYNCPFPKFRLGEKNFRRICYL